MDLALKILDVGSPLDLETLFVTTWAIWFNRNQEVHEAKCSPHSQIWNLAVHTQEDYKNAILYNHVKQQAPDVGWAAPPPGIYKINVDGATAGFGGRSTMGVVIRDSRGMVVAVSYKVLNGDYGAAVTEAFAVNEGVRLAMELELQQIIVESDSVGVVEAINESNCNGEFGMVIQGSLELLQSFRSWNVRYRKRDYNRAAHELAQFAKAVGSSQQWKGVEPPMLRHVLLLDRAKS